MLFIARILLFLSFFSLLSRLMFGLLGLTQQDDSLMTATVWCVTGWLSFWQGPLYQTFLQQLAHVGGNTWLPPEGRVILPFINGPSGNYSGSEVDLSALLGLAACCMAAGLFRAMETLLELLTLLYIKLRPVVLKFWFRKRRKLERIGDNRNALSAPRLQYDHPPVDLSSPQLATPPTHLVNTPPLTSFVFQPGPYQANLFHSQFYQTDSDLSINNRFRSEAVHPGNSSRNFQKGQLPHIVSPRASIMLPGHEGDPPPRPAPS